MRTTRRTSKFNADYRRELRGRYRATVAADLESVVSLLAADVVLPRRYRDHRMAGIWNGYRNCHIRPNLILLYRKIGEQDLELARLGSHPELRIL